MIEEVNRAVRHLAVQTSTPAKYLSDDLWDCETCGWVNQATEELCDSCGCQRTDR